MGISPVEIIELMTERVFKHDKFVIYQEYLNLLGMYLKNPGFASVLVDTKVLTKI